MLRMPPISSSVLPMALKNSLISWSAPCDISQCCDFVQSLILHKNVAPSPILLDHSLSEKLTREAPSSQNLFTCHALMRTESRSGQQPTTLLFIVPKPNQRAQARRTRFSRRFFTSAVSLYMGKRPSPFCDGAPPPLREARKLLRDASVRFYTAHNSVSAPPCGVPHSFSEARGVSKTPQKVLRHHSANRALSNVR